MRFLDLIHHMLGVTDQRLCVVRCAMFRINKVQVLIEGDIIAVPKWSRAAGT